MKAGFAPRPAARFRSIKSAAALYVVLPCICGPSSQTVVASPRSIIFPACSLQAPLRPAGGVHRTGTAMHKSVSAIGVLVLVFALSAPLAVHAEIVSVPSAAPSDPVAPLPPPTVLRGSRPAPAQPACPPGYTLSQDYPDYGCIAASGGGYAEGSQGYDYWPGYGWGHPFFGLPAFGAGAGRFHRVAGSHGFRGLPGRAGLH